MTFGHSWALIGSNNGWGGLLKAWDFNGWFLVKFDLLLGECLGDKIKLFIVRVFGPNQTKIGW